MYRSYPIDNRIDAGIQIASNENIKKYCNRNDTIILALPRGGVYVEKKNKILSHKILISKYYNFNIKKKKVFQ